MAKSLLHMISNDIGQLACLYAKLHGLDRVYFGGFFIRGHPVTMRTITYSINFFSKVRAPIPHTGPPQLCSFQALWAASVSVEPARPGGEGPEAGGCAVGHPLPGPLPLPSGESRHAHWGPHGGV